MNALCVVVNQADLSECNFLPKEYLTKTPTRAGGIVRESAVTVRVAISAAEALTTALEPEVTMLGLRKHPSQKMLLSWRALTTAVRTFSVTF